MKGIAQILLMVFMMALVAPTVVTIIKKDSARTIAFNLSEEEEIHKEFKVLTSQNRILNIDLFFEEVVVSSLILSENLSRHNNVTASIFSPPPNSI